MRYISATSTRNYLMRDPLIDWLEEHQKVYAQGPPLHSHSKVRSKTSSANFNEYILEQGHIFESVILQEITKKFGKKRVIEIGGEHGAYDQEKVAATISALQRGVPFIHGAVLFDEQRGTVGVADLLVRSDWLNLLIKTSVLGKEKSLGSKFNKNWHYRVVDIKYTSLKLRADGIHLLNSGAFPAYKGQLLIYTWALGILQGYTPPEAYILGRRWDYSKCGADYFGEDAFDRLGVINYEGVDIGSVYETEKALNWIREVRSKEAGSWDIHNPKRWELYPNMCNKYDHPWNSVKRELAKRNYELTSLWMVGPKNRNKGLEAGVFAWNDPACTAEVLGINGVKTQPILQAIIEINQSKDEIIRPQYIEHDIFGWKKNPKLEFYVDFETYNGAVSDILDVRNADVDNLIFMIGVGYVSKGEWIYKNFTSTELSFEGEFTICKDFYEYVQNIAKKHRVPRVNCVHWSSAEQNWWEAAMQRYLHEYEEWCNWSWEWLDLLTVFKEGPIVINGALSFGLKDIATAMQKHKLIETVWEDSSCNDGRNAMLIAKKCQKIADRMCCDLGETPEMVDVIKYNEVDCKVLSEIITYLRENHVLENKSISTHKEGSKKRLLVDDYVPNKRSKTVISTHRYNTRSKSY